MKNPFLLTLLICGLCVSAAYTEQTGANPQFGLLGGGQFGSEELESGAAIVGTAGIRFTPLFAVDIQGGWMPAKSKEERIANADLTITSVEIIPRIYVPMGRLQPYIGAGAGRFFIDEDLDDSTGLVVSQDVENKWGGVFGGGIDLAITENMALAFDVSYIYLRSKVNTQTALGSTSQSVNLDSVRALAGLRIKFNSPGWSNVYE